MNARLRLSKLNTAKAWMKLGAFAHGTTIDESFVVPKDVAIVFLTHPGDLCRDSYIEHLLMSDSIMNDLIVQKAIVDKDPVFSITYLPGDTCPETILDFRFDGIPEGIWSLPLPRSFPSSGIEAQWSNKKQAYRQEIALNTARWSIRDLKQMPETDRYSSDAIRLSTLSYKVLRSLTGGKPTVLFVTSCRFTDEESTFRRARALNAAVSLVPINVGYGPMSPPRSSARLKKTKKGPPELSGSSRATEFGKDTPSPFYVPKSLRRGRKPFEDENGGGFMSVYQAALADKWSEKQPRNRLGQFL